MDKKFNYQVVYKHPFNPDELIMILTGVTEFDVVTLLTQKLIVPEGYQIENVVYQPFKITENESKA